MPNLTEIYSNFCSNEKSPQRDANTALWLYSKADPKIIAQPQTPFPGARITYKPSLVRIDARNFELSR